MRKLPIWLVFTLAVTIVPWSAWQAVQFVALAVDVTRYVDDVAGACVGTYSVANRDCTGSDGSSYATIAAGLSATGAGDILYVRAGTFPVQITGAIPSGVSASSKTYFSAYFGETVTLNPSNTSDAFQRVIHITGQDNIVISRFVIDGAGVTGDGIKLDSFSDNVEIIGNEVKNAPGQCLYIGRETGNIIRNNNLHHCGVDGFEHGIYYSATTSGIIENNKIHDNAGAGIQFYPEAVGTQFRRNKVYNNCQGATVTSGSQVIIASNSHNTVVEYNEIYETAGSCTNGILTNLGTPQNSIIRHNSIYCSGSCTLSTGAGVKINAGTGATVANNIILGYSNATLTSGGSGTTFTDNLTSGTAADIWTNPGTDFTLKAGSIAIDGGTEIGLSKCGTLPDQGAYEVCGFSAASIIGHTMDVTMENIYPPLQVFGSTGWSVACTPNSDACGTPTVASATLLSGSGSVVRLTISGIANTDCTTNQIWTVSFNAATGFMTDYIVMGGVTNQAAHSFTGRAVTNNCTGSGGPEPPVGEYIYYTMNGNANDSSGGNRHATTSGVSFAAAKYEQGMQTNSGENDYAELPYLSGVNPSSQSLTIAYGVYIPASDLNLFRYVGGVPLGTDQRMYVMRNTSNNWRQGIQANAASSATEFTAQAGWTHICQTMNAATDTATLWINGQQGAVSGASVQTYTSYTFSANYRIGLPSGRSVAQGGNHLYDEFRLYQSVVSCADLYAAWEPPTSTWTGTLSLVSARIYSAKTTWLGGLFPLAALDANATASPGGAFTYAGQIDCTAANCSAVSYVLYYSCAACPSAGAESPVPNTASADELEMFGSSIESGMLSGAQGSNLSGALAHINGGTLFTLAPTSGPDLAQNNSTVHRATMRFTTAATVGRVYCFKWREQSGLALNSYTPSGGLCVTVGAHSAAAGF